MNLLETLLLSNELVFVLYFIRQKINVTQFLRTKSLAEQAVSQVHNSGQREGRIHSRC